MIIIQKLFYFILLLFISIFSFSQNIKLSGDAKISIITYGPGDVLYEKFGHTAIRIKDPMLKLDLIYNYGIFDFTEKNFYLNFIKGYMKYRLARYRFPPSLKSYNKNKRWVKEQILNLNTQQVNNFFKYLENNAKPENASYLYDPFFNNCSTKPRDIIKEILGKSVIYKNNNTNSNNTIRELMNREINTNTWGGLGINIALGNKLDKIANSDKCMYLPDYVYQTLEKSSILKDGKEENLVSKTNILLNYPEKQANSDKFSPLLVFSILLFIGIFISFQDIKKVKHTKWLDIVLLLITGIFGVLVIFLWFFTNHSTAPYNFNMLWAVPTNLILAWKLYKNKTSRWITHYVKILLFFLLGFIPIVWILNIQLLPYSLIPLFLLLSIRYWVILKVYKKLRIANS